MLDLRTSSAPIAASELAMLQGRDFYRAMGRINESASTASEASDVARQDLRTLLTEQVARHIGQSYPGTALLFATVAAEFHHTADGEPVVGCEGHGHRLIPVQVLDADGETAGEVEPYSPLFFLLERLTPLLGAASFVLDVHEREWVRDIN